MSRRCLSFLVKNNRSGQKKKRIIRTSLLIFNTYPDETNNYPQW